MNRRHFLESAAAGAAAVGIAPRLAAAPRPAPSGELDNATIAELQEAMGRGAVTAEALVQHALERIEQLDRRGPMLRAVLETNPDAPAQARALDQERAAKGPRGPLHGIPVLLKDNIATADRMTTTAGALALEGTIAPRDAFIVGRLRAAGAVLLGKANMSEWANFRSTHASSGWSGRGGQGRNPYALDRSPCGSSSGAAGAVAADYCPVAVGTETDGSIICPSAAQSCVGIKPTLGLVSRSGIIPIAASQDTAGPIARTVADAAALLGVLAGPDPADAVTRSRRPRITDYAASLDANGLKGARIGVARAAFFGYHPATDKLVDDAIAVLRDRGAVIVDPADLTTNGKYGDSEFTVLLYEFKAGLNAYLAALGPAAPVKSLADVIAFNERNRARAMPFFGQEILEMAIKKGPLTDPAYRAALARDRRLAGRQGIDATLQRHRLDALVAPSGGPTFLIDLINGDHELGSSYGPAAVAGYPGITVPAGYVHGLPVGISFFAGAYSEPTLIRLAYAYEQASALRTPPSFRPTADLR